MGLKKIIVLRALFFLWILLSCSAMVHSSPLDLCRTVKVGLVSLGRPSAYQLEPSTGYIEIFDNSKKQSLFSGKAGFINITLQKDKQIKIFIDNRKSLYSSSDELLFSAVGRPPVNIKVKAGAKKSFAYRGSIAVLPNKGGLLAVNHVDIEDYLKSVVPCEIFTRAPDAAQEAQTIAARTYAFRNIDRHRGDKFDLCDTVHCQVYVGIVRETNIASKAVKSTEGLVLTHGGAFANTVYHSNCGGYIISSKAAWNGSPIPYLVGHYDGTPGEEPFCFFGSRLKKSQPTGKLPKPQKDLKISPLAWNARALKHKNFGHRVGMCQDGAIGMAAIGYNSRKILAFYYPGTRLETMNYVVPGSRITEEPVVVAMTTPKINLETPPNPAQVSVLALNRKTSPGNKNLLDTLKEVASSKPANTSMGIRKMFWNPAQPEISRQTRIF
jgi:stage II sporulation protein D